MHSGTWSDPALTIALALATGMISHTLAQHLNEVRLDGVGRHFELGGQRLRRPPPRGVPVQEEQQVEAARPSRRRRSGSVSRHPGAGLASRFLERGIPPRSTIVRSVPEDLNAAGR